MTLVTINNNVTEKTKEERINEFLQNLQKSLEQEVLRRKFFIENLLQIVWSNTSRTTLPTGPGPEEDPSDNSISLEDKIEALNDAGIALPLFSASTADINHLQSYVSGLEIREPELKGKYNITVVDGKIEIELKPE
jgi:hypothetical protein